MPLKVRLTHESIRADRVGSRALRDTRLQGRTYPLRSNGVLITAIQRERVSTRRAAALKESPFP
jgi:hypothetical protein